MNTVWMLQLDEAKEEFVCQKGINEGSRFYEGLPIDDPKALLMKRTDTCTQFTGSSGKVNAVSVNPVDTKLRQDNGIRNALRILGLMESGKLLL